MKQIIKWSDAHPWIVTFFIVGCIVLSCMNLSEVRIDTSSKNFMRASDPAKLVYQEMIDTFGSDQLTVVCLHDENLFTPEKLKILSDLTYQLEDVNGIVKVESLATVKDLRNDNGMLYSGSLMDWVPETAEEAAEIKKHAMNNPIVHSNMLSEDGNATAINLYLDAHNMDDDFLTRIHDCVEAVIEPYRGRIETIFQLGTAYKVKSYKSTIDSDFTVIFPLACLLLIASVVVMMGTFMAAVIPLITASLSILFTFGFMGALGIPLTLLTFIVPCLLLVVGSTEDMHMISEYIEGYRHTKDQKQAIHYMADKTGTAILLTAVTTILGFLSISLNDMVLLRQFGFSSAFGLTSNFIATVLCVPHLVKMFPNQRWPEPSTTRMDRWVDGISSRLVSLIYRFKGLVLLIGIGLVLFGGYWGMRVRVDNNTLEYFRPGHPMLERIKTLNKYLSGSNSFLIRIMGNKDDFLEPENLKSVDRFQQAVQNTAWIDKTVSFVDYIKLIDREIHEGNPEYYGVPELEQTVQEYCLFLSQDDVGKYVTPNYDGLAILVRHSNYSSKVLHEGIEGLYALADSMLPAAFQVDICGEDVLVNRAADTIAKGQVRGLVIIAGVVLLVLILLFMNAWTGLYSMLPNLIPVGVIFLVMYVFDIPLNTGTCLIAVISIGIAVDDTIHILSRYQSIMHRVQNERDALRESLRTEMVPVISTSVSLAIGFGLLSLSSFLPIAQFGFLSALVMLIALAADLTVTPAVLLLTQYITIWDLLELRVRQEVLTRSPLFRDFTRWQLKKLILLGKLSEAPERAVIVTKGETGRSMYLILEGNATVFLPASGDKGETVLTRFGPGDIFGEIALINECRRTASIRADTPLNYIEFDMKGVERIKKYNPLLSSKLMLNIARILGHRLNEANEAMAKR